MRARPRAGSWPAATEVLLAVAALGVVVGGVLWAVDRATPADWAWSVTTLVGLGAAIWWVGGAALHGRLGVDVIAVLALGGALAVGEPLAGALIALMLASGRALEARASARAEAELRALVGRVPTRVHLRRGDQIVDVAPDEVDRGDLVVVEPGEVVPVDGRVVGGPATLDEAALTGEPLPVERPEGDEARSGVVNAGSVFELRATTTAADSTYAGVVRLVEQSQASSSPFVRLADRYALVFVLATLALTAATWAVSGEAVRAVAVLVVATPCPLILAAPVAIVSGMSRAAHRGVLVKGGAVLERLAGAEVLLVDKTGTLTAGRPELAAIVPAPGWEPEDVLRLAASLDQLSPHVLAAAVVAGARERSLDLVLPTDVVETAGRGIEGRVAGRAVAAGRASWLVAGNPPWLRAVRRRAQLDGALTVFVAVDHEPAGALVFEDRIRPDAARTVRKLREDGIRRVVMVSGDREDVARTVGAVIGVDEVLAERSPAEKVDAVRDERRRGCTVMVGDGINDAPALAIADVGVAIGARGTSASSEAADVVLAADRLDRLGDGVAIARRARRIGTQSVVVGISLSVAAMGLAALGLLPPAWGALLQEGIDVAVILNALRVLRPAEGGPVIAPADASLVRGFSEAHESLRPDLDRLQRAADHIDQVPAGEALREVRDVHRFLVEEVAPHEQAEDSVLYPVLDRVLGGSDPTGPMSRAHAEIFHLIRRLGLLLDQIDPDEPDHDDLLEVRRVLYGLDAILRLHFAQEEEGYLSLVDPAEVAAT